MSPDPTPADPPVRVRIAPSPTGDPHVGTAYAAMFNLAFARRHGGRFVLRIEDTDRTRYVEGSEQQIFTVLRWLGLTWDEGPDIGGPYGPYRQSERLDTYRVAVDQLLAQGNAYWCWCSSERLARMREEQQRAKRATGYDRMCYGLTREQRAELPGFTDQAVVRMYIPEGAKLSFDDLIRGETNAPHPDDQVLLKADGYPTYHLAVVVDDHTMDITHVIRGEEWVSSTPKHLMLYGWLGWRAPRFGHFPLLRNPDRSKISKRKNPAARLKWFQEQGFLPEALVNFLALMGYSMPDGQEIFTFDELAASFDLDRVNSVGAVFDVEKLTWLSGHYMRKLSDAEFLDASRPFLPAGVGDDDIRPILAALRERTRKLSEIPGQVDWLAGETVEVSVEALVKQGLPAAELPAALEAVAAELAALDPFEPAGIEATLDKACGELSANRRRLFMTCRVAVVGKPVSPPLHETMAALGRDRTVARLRAAAAAS